MRFLVMISDGLKSEIGGSIKGKSVEDVVGKLGLLRRKVTIAGLKQCEADFLPGSEYFVNLFPLEEVKSSEILMERARQLAREKAEGLVKSYSDL